MTLDIEQIEADLAAGRTDDASGYSEAYYRTVRQLIEEVKRLRHQAIGLSESASKSLILYANAGTEADGLRAEVERLRAEVERLSSPKPGFLTWLNELSDLLPPGMAMGVNVEELRRRFEEGMTAEGAAERINQEIR